MFITALLSVIYLLIGQHWVATPHDQRRDRWIAPTSHRRVVRRQRRWLGLARSAGAGNANGALEWQPTFAGIYDTAGAVAPTNYTLTLNSGALVRYVLRRVDPLAMPIVTAPQWPTARVT